MKSEFKKFIKSKIRQNVRFVFISPHLDDAALSCGDLLNYLFSLKAKVLIINVFTKSAKGPYTISAKRHLAKCGFKNAIELYKQRINEDNKAFSNLKFDVFNLGFTDALYRKKRIGKLLRVLNIPELYHIYPVKVFRNRVSTYDANLIKNISKRLRKTILKNDLVFCPSAVGGHVDHILVRNLCRENFANVIYWWDVPYSDKYGVIDKFVLDENLKKEEFINDIDKKSVLVEYYKTQIRQLNKSPYFQLSPERYFQKI